MRCLACCAFWDANQGPANNGAPASEMGLLLLTKDCNCRGAEMSLAHLRADRRQRASYTGPAAEAEIERGL